MIFFFYNAYHYIVTTVSAKYVVRWRKNWKLYLNTAQSVCSWCYIFKKRSNIKIRDVLEPRRPGNVPVTCSIHCSCSHWDSVLSAGRSWYCTPLLQCIFIEMVSSIVTVLVKLASSSAPEAVFLSILFKQLRSSTCYSGVIYCPDRCSRVTWYLLLFSALLHKGKS